MPEEILQDDSPDLLVRALYKNRLALHCLSKRWPEADIRESEDIAWCITDLRDPFLNCVYHTNLTPERVSEVIEEVKERARARDVNVWWLICPWSRPPELGKYLEASGFRQDVTTGMALGLANADFSGGMGQHYKIERVGDEEALDEWCRIAITGFEMPDEVTEDWCRWYRAIGLGQDAPVRHYLMWYKGGPVATASILPAAGVAGIYNVATVPGHRKQGAGYRIMMYVLEESRNLGYRFAVLQSTEKGISLYRRLGFRELCPVVSYYWILDRPRRPMACKP